MVETVTNCDQLKKILGRNYYDIDIVGVFKDGAELKIYWNWLQIKLLKKVAK